LCTGKGRSGVPACSWEFAVLDVIPNQENAVVDANDEIIKL
jgi:hypothetical protein